mgnify:FL=1
MRSCYRTFFLLIGVSLSLLLTACMSSLPMTPEQLAYRPLDFSFPEVETRALDNGIQLYLKQDDELPLVQVTALIGSGTIGVSRDLTGFGGVFSETLRTGGTAAYLPDHLEERLEALAANLSAGAGALTCELNLSVRTEDLQEGLTILAELLRHPTFDPNSLELARLKSLEDVRRQNDLPRSVAQRLLKARLYPEHPLGDSPTQESLLRITRNQLIEFHHQHFAPNNLMLAISGDFENDALLGMLENLLGDWAPREASELQLPPVQAPAAGEIQVVDKKLAQTTVLIGDLGLTKDNPDMYAVRVMNYILGGGGFNSRLMQEVRSNRGLAYSVYSYFQFGRRLPGTFVASTETQNASVGQVLMLMRQIMQDLREQPVPEAELRLARESLINSFVFGFEDSHAVASQKMRLDLFDYPEDYLQSYRDRIAAVTIADVQRVAQKYLQPERQQVVLVGSAAEFSDKLVDFGLPVRLVSVEQAP